MIDNRIDRVADLISEVNVSDDRDYAVRVLDVAFNEWSAFADEFPIGDLTVRKVGILLRKSRGRFAVDNPDCGREVLADAMAAVRQVAER